MLRVVLDSSVLISAFLTPRGVCAELFRGAERGAFTLCLSPELLEDMLAPLLRSTKLQQRYRYDRRAIALFCDGLMTLAERSTIFLTCRMAYRSTPRTIRSWQRRSKPMPPT